MENRENATMQEPVVWLENVVVSYGEEPVLKDVNMRLGGGDFAYLIGKSGAGKTHGPPHHIGLQQTAHLTVANSIDLLGSDGRGALFKGL